MLAATPPPLLRGVIRRFVLLSLLALAASLARGQTGQLNVGADSSVFDVATNETVLRGNARVSDGIVLITADEMRLADSKTDRAVVITAIGHVIYTQTNRRLLADKLVLDRKAQTFRAEHVRFGSHPYYAEADSAEGSQEEITFIKATASFGEPGRWQPTVRADKVIYAPGKRLRTENAQAGIGQLQPLPFPHFQQNLKEPLLSVASFNGGYRSTLGAFAEASVHIPTAAELRLGGDLGLYSNRGVMFGPGGSYGSGAEDSTLHGYFRSGYINDHGDRKSDILGNPVPKDRAYIEWQHQQNITDKLSLTAQVNWWKDSEILRDFRPRDFYPVQQPDTFIEGVYADKNYFISAFGRFQPNNFDRVQERLPEIRFDLLPTAIGNGFYERFSASFAVLRDDAPSPSTIANTADYIKTAYGLSPFTDGALYFPYTTYAAIPQHQQFLRFDSYYGLSRPITQGDWLAFTPVVGGRFTHYSDAEGGPKSSVSRTLGEVGFDTELHAAGTFDYKNALWNIDGLRHLFTPRLSYRRIFGEEKKLYQIPPIDRQAFSTYLQPLGLGDQRNVDDIKPLNIVRLALENTIQTRDSVYGSRDLFTFTIANDYRFNPVPGEKNSSSIQTSVAFAPAHWVSVGVYQNFAPKNLSLEEFNSQITLHDGDAWSVQLANNYLTRQIQDYHVNGRFRINETYEALTRLQYDSRKKRFNEQAYGVTQNLGNTWLISYIVTLYSGPRRESHFGLNIQIAARGF